DQMPIGARYEELASLVGPDDAVQTPESVLALTQPTIMMTMGAGIGGLAQEAMDVPVEGDMAGGIMQMAAPPPQLPPPPMDPMMDPGMEAGGTPPVNFNQGGLVRRGDNQPVQKFSNGGTPTVSSFEPGGVVEMAGLNQVFSPQDLQNMSYGYKLGQQATLDAAPDLMSEFEGRSDLYREILGSDEQTQAANKGQFLFDLAKFGLALANEPGGRSPGEIIARAATGSKLVENIQARSAAEKARKEKLDLAALSQTEQDLRQQKELQSKYDIASIRDSKDTDLKQFIAKADITVNNTPVGKGQSFMANRATQNEVADEFGVRSFSPYVDESQKNQVSYEYRGPENAVAIDGVPLVPGRVYPLDAEEVAELPPDQRSYLRRITTAEGGKKTIIAVDPNSPYSIRRGGGITSLVAFQTPDGTLMASDEQGQMTQLVTGKMVSAPDNVLPPVVLTEGQAKSRSADYKDSNLASMYASISNAVKLDQQIPEISTLSTIFTNREPQIIDFNEFEKVLKETGDQQEAVQKAGYTTKSPVLGEYEGGGKYRLYDVVSAVKNNVGLWPNVGRTVINFANAVNPATSENFKKKGTDYELASAWLKTLQVLAAGGLANSSRMPVADVRSKEELFADADQFFDSPQRALANLRVIKDRLIQEMDDLALRYNSGSLTSDQRNAYANKGRNLVLALRMLEGIEVSEGVSSSTPSNIGI
ncbi:MAG TPA: hypothetical protein DEB18_02870, partial [Leeuwenhoekiella sp.]|nr:hypothetical protein [Leeuwenhoekiella sp.]